MTYTFLTVYFTIYKKRHQKIHTKHNNMRCKIKSSKNYKIKKKNNVKLLPV